MSDEKNIVVNPAPHSKLPLSLALIAGILAVGSIAFTAYNTSSFTAQLHQFKENQTQATIADAAQQSEHIQALEKRIKQFETQSNTPHNQKINEITYLIHLANWQLTLQNNPTLALKTLSFAQQLLNTLQDTDLASLKNALSADITTLHSFAAVPVDQLFTQIKTINDAVLTLSPIAAPVAPKAATTASNKKDTIETEAELREYLHEVGGKIKSLFIVRHLDKPSTPLLVPALEMTLKQNITSQLNMAEWALLHHNQTVFMTALQTVSSWLSQYFTSEPGSDLILKQLDTLQKLNINPAAPTLDNTLAALASTHTATPQPIVDVPGNLSAPVTTPVAPQIKNPTPNTTDEKNQNDMKPAKTNSAPVET